MKVLYTTQAVADGEGRNGRARTADGVLDVQLAVPTELGGAGGATNPEQLFAAGYAACFHSALKVVARRAKADLGESEVAANIGLTAESNGGFGLTAELVVSLPGLPQEQAEQLVAAADQVCPYSNAVRGNIEVALTVAGAEAAA